MTLVIAGDVDPAALHAKLDGGIGPWKPSTAKPLARVVAMPQKIARLLRFDRAVAAQSDVRIQAHQAGPQRQAILRVRRHAFDPQRRLTSRLNQRLREQFRITYCAGAGMG